jgi:hypothetical protein
MMRFNHEGTKSTKEKGEKRRIEYVVSSSLRALRAFVVQWFGSMNEEAARAW